MEHLDVDGGSIEYQVYGKGEPILLIPPGVTIDGLAFPLLGQRDLRSRYQIIHYHRRGYMGSTPGPEPLTIIREAADAAALLKHLGVRTAHIAGHSIGGIIALQLALDAPDLVHSLALLEPPVLQLLPDGRSEMERRFMPVMNAFRSGNKRKAIGIFSDAVFGPGWQSIVEKAIPGGLEQAVRDADTFAEELPAIQAWEFGPREAVTIRRPMLLVMGDRSSPFMKEGRRLLHAWFPQAEDLSLPTTHLLQMEDPQGAAGGLAAFFSRHPMGAGDPER